MAYAALSTAGGLRSYRITAAEPNTSMDLAWRAKVTSVVRCHLDPFIATTAHRSLILVWGSFLRQMASRIIQGGVWATMARFTAKSKLAKRIAGQVCTSVVSHTDTEARFHAAPGIGVRGAIDLGAIAQDCVQLRDKGDRHRVCAPRRGRTLLEEELKRGRGVGECWNVVFVVRIRSK